MSPSPASTPSPTPTDLPTTSPSPHPVLPLPMSASLLLTSLPPDSTTALTHAAQISQPTGKVTVRFKAVGSAPILKQQVYRISAAQRFDAVVRFLRGRLLKGSTAGGDAGLGVFCYVNSVFAPGLDEVVGDLGRCFATGGELVVGYSLVPAFG